MSSNCGGTSAAGLPPRRRPLGCLTCRKRKVKCDLTQPVCAACNRLDKECQWQGTETTPPPRQQRRPNATACEACRSRKMKCEGDQQLGACTRCLATSTACTWSMERAASTRPRTAREPLTPRTGSAQPSLPLDTARSPPPLDFGPYSSQYSSPFQSSPRGRAGTSASSLSFDPEHSTAPGPLLTQALAMTREPSMTQAHTEAMVDLYFDTVHNFGFMTFIHEMRFKRLLRRGKAPRDLTMAMVASVLRFASEPTPANLSHSDTLVDTVVGRLLPGVLDGFGVTQLMTTLLICKCEGYRGRVGSRFLLAGLCVRMMQLMSLHMLDDTFPNNLAEAPLSPLLTYEALRRVAWSVFFMDSSLDGGRYGSGLVDVHKFRNQLPCNEQSFLGNDNPRTASIFASPSEQNGALGLSAYLIRAILLRRRALDISLRLSYQDYKAIEIQTDLTALEASITETVNSLPARYHFTGDNVFLNRQRLPAFLLVHVLLHGLYLVLGTIKISLYSRDPCLVDFIPDVRRQRISHALAASGIYTQGLKYDKPFDMLAASHSYAFVEILLFEPRRLAQVDPTIDPNTSDIASAIPPLLTVLRQASRRSEVVRLLHIEAVHRLLRCEYLPILDSYDLEAFGTEYHPGQDEAEFDFSNFRFARIERLRSTQRPATGLDRDEPLLEYGHTATESASASPRLDAAHVNSSNIVPSSSSSRPSALGLSPLDPPALGLGDVGSAHPWLNLLNPMANAAVLSMPDMSWLPGEEGLALQTGDPDDFWRQITSGPSLQRTDAIV